MVKLGTQVEVTRAWGRDVTFSGTLVKFDDFGFTYYCNDTDELYVVPWKKYDTKEYYQDTKYKIRCSY